MKQFYIAPTYRCNNRCPMCGVFNSKKDSDWKYTLEELRQEIDKKNIEEGDVVIVSGGEPTIYEYFFELLKYLNEKKARITIFSNGRAFKNMDFVKKLSECEYENILIPLFGSTPEIHEKLVGAKGSYADTFEGLKNLDSANMPYSIKTVVMKDNYQDLRAWAELITATFSNPQMISIHGLHLQGEAPKIAEQLYVRHDEATKYVEDALDVLIDKKLNAKIGISAFPLCTIDPIYWKYNIVSKIQEYTTISEDSKEIKETNIKNYAERLEQCENCQVKLICEWPWRMYKKEFGLEYIKAF